MLLFGAGWDFQQHVLHLKKSWVPDLWTFNNQFGRTVLINVTSDYLFMNSTECTIRLISSKCIYFVWVTVFKNGPSKTCGRQPLKNLKWYGRFTQLVSNLFTIYWNRSFFYNSVKKANFNNGARFLPHNLRVDKNVRINPQEPPTSWKHKMKCCAFIKSKLL